MAQFYLKAEAGRDKVLRVREYVRLENGYDGLTSDQIKLDLPVAYGKFVAKLEEFGHDKALDVARAEGVFIVPGDARAAAVVEREIVATERKLSELRLELKDATDGEVLREDKKGSKKKEPAKVEEKKDEK